MNESIEEKQCAPVRNLVIDFNGYITPENQFNIKEYSLYFLNKKGDVITNSFEVQKPRIDDFRYVDHVTRANYEKFYEIYGINWNTGTINSQDFEKALRYFVRRSYKVFVANDNQKNSLVSYLNKTNDISTTEKILSLWENFDYKMEFKNSTYCRNHESPSHNNCANDNVLDMMKYITDIKLYRSSSLRRTHVVIDFSYTKKLNHWIWLKELSICEIDYKGEIQFRKLYVSLPYGKFKKKLSNYEKYYNDYGIKWEAGNSTPLAIHKYLKFIAKTALNIYVKNASQRKILMTIINEVNRSIVIRLDELGYEAGSAEAMSTECKWHDNKSMNNCANDNVKLMTDWLLETKLYNPRVRNNFTSRQMQYDDDISEDERVESDDWRDKMAPFIARYDKVYRNREL